MAKPLNQHFDFDTAGYSNLEDLIPEKVNRNGSAKETLMANYIGILNALRALDVAMALGTPHGRDYQTHTTAFADQAARAAWSQRRVWLGELKRDIEHSALMVQNQ